MRRPEGHPLVITTESRAGHARRFLVRGLHGVTIAALAFAALAGGVPFKGMGRGAALLIALLAALGAVTFVLSPLLARMEVRGTWILEPSSVAFAPVDGRTRVVPWAEVTRVRATSERIDVRTRGASLPLGGRMLDGAQWAALVAAVRAALGDRLDIDDALAGGRVWLLVRPAATATLACLAAWLQAAEGRLWPAAVVVALIAGQSVLAALRTRAAPWAELRAAPA